MGSDDASMLLLGSDVDWQCRATSNNVPAGRDTWLQLLMVLTPSLTLGAFLGGVPGGGDSFSFPKTVKLNDGATFEYIVVGAGGAGCAAAARLAERGARVLLVEAGGDPSALTKVPSASMLLLGSDVDWQYRTTSNNVSCLASRGRQCRFSRGKCLGGSTSINYMLYARGNRRDYDYGIPGWSWEDLKPYFLRYEGLQVLDQFPRSSIPYHNTSGAVKIEYFDDSLNPWHSRIFRGYRELRFPKNRDVNGVSQIGVTQVVGYVYDGERMSAARAYLTRKNVNLKVIKNALCTGVIIDDAKIARGITLLPAGAPRPLRVFARNEVILSAGAIGTPQILILSGVGPAEHLNSMGIPVRADLPVGDNMSDHVLPLIIILVDKGINVTGDLVNLLSTTEGVVEYLAARDGPLASNGLSDLNVFANTLCYNGQKRRLENGSDDCEVPNMQIIHAYVGRNLIPLAKPLFQQGTGLDDDTVDQLANANTDNAFIILSSIMLSPKSRGKIRLASDDPVDRPSILPNYLSSNDDVDEMLRSIQIVEDLVRTVPFKSNNATILRLKFPGCPPYERSRAGYWRCYVRHMTYAVFHAVDTCALGAVLDAELRVRGVRRLRVADVSVLPSIPRGNTAAAALALGERVADFIQQSS